MNCVVFLAMDADANTVVTLVINYHHRGPQYKYTHETQSYI